MSPFGLMGDPKGEMKKKGHDTLLIASCLEERSVSSVYIQEHNCSNSDNDAHGTRLGSCISLTQLTRTRMQFEVGSRLDRFDPREIIPTQVKIPQSGNIRPRQISWTSSKNHTT